MNYEEYKKAYFISPVPEPKFNILGIHGVALYFDDYEKALDYYTAVLGPPAYIEGQFTHGWPLGSTWLTLFPAKTGSPGNLDITILMPSSLEAERLQGAFIAAGGTGAPPSDQIMYQPIRMCPVKDPFGTEFLIIALLPQ